MYKSLESLHSIMIAALEKYNQQGNEAMGFYCPLYQNYSSAFDTYMQAVNEYEELNKAG